MIIVAGAAVVRGFAAVAALAQDRLPTPEVDPDEARRLADDVLSQPRYRNSESILDRALRLVADAFGRVLSQLTTGSAGSVVAWIILGALVLGLATVLRNTLGPVPIHGRSEAPTPLIVSDQTDRRTAAQWRLEAERLAGVGAYDEAIRARYRAVVADLVDAGTLDAVAGTTPGEHRRRLIVEEAPIAPTFAALTDVFESVWYGPVDARSADLDRFVSLEQSLAGVAVKAGS